MTIRSKEMTDASELQFDNVGSGGAMETISSLVGETFELQIPGEQMSGKPSDHTCKVLLTLESKGTTIQVPLSAEPDSEGNWLEMKLARDSK
ncbi:hypothetical protein [Novipirellula artificiosorum]|nr:hypothetical protein [Novipirellula artificiosorum]